MLTINGTSVPFLRNTEVTYFWILKYNIGLLVCIAPYCTIKFCMTGTSKSSDGMTTDAVRLNAHIRSARGSSWKFVIPYRGLGYVKV